MMEVDYYFITITPEKTVDLKYPPLYSPRLKIAEIILKKYREDKWFIYDKEKDNEKEWIDTFINCIGAPDAARSIVLVTHNVQFTRDILYKTFIENGYEIGFNGSLLKWNWFSTMIDFRERFYKDVPVESNTEVFPSLYKILPYIPGCDAAMLGNKTKSLIELEKIFRIYIFNEWDEKIKTLLNGDTKWYNKPLNTGSRLNIPPVAYFIRFLPGMSNYKNTLGDVAFEVSRVLGSSVKHADISITNELQLIGAHLLCYGFIRSVYGKINLKRSSSETSFHDDDDKEEEEDEGKNNDWYNILHEIESLLRQKGRIYNDEVIHAMLCAVCNCYSYELAFIEFSEGRLEKGETGKRRDGLLFNSGEPVSYLPFDFTADFASDVYKKLGYASSYEILSDYVNTTKHPKSNNKTKKKTSGGKEILSNENIIEKRQFIAKFAEIRSDFHHFITIDRIEDILANQEKSILERFPLVYLLKDYSCLF